MSLQRWGHDVRKGYRTYDFIDVINQDDLGRRLPFPESNNIYGQLWYLLGTQESWLPRFRVGVWEGFGCSLNKYNLEDLNLPLIRASLQAVDEALLAALQHNDLLKLFTNETLALGHYLRLAEHEALHQGQLINFIYALNLPIPTSWADDWALTRNS